MAEARHLKCLQCGFESHRGHETDLSTVQATLLERDLHVHSLAVVVVGRGKLQAFEQPPQFGREQSGSRSAIDGSLLQKSGVVGKLGRRM